MSSTRDWEDLFDAQANEPLAWIEVARTLRLGAQPVFTRMQEIQDVSQNIDAARLEKLGCARAYMLLTAVVFENMLKAIAVKRGLLTADRGRLRFDRSLSRNRHGLRRIAETLKLDLTPGEVDLLERLEQYLVWAARYPVPLLAQQSVRAEEESLLSLIPSDVQVGDNLFNRLLGIALQAA